MSQYSHVLVSEDKPLSVKLTHEQQRLVLTLFDNGLMALKEPSNQQALNALIGKLKDEIHP